MISHISFPENLVIVLVDLGIKKTLRKNQKRWAKGWKKFVAKKKKTGRRSSVTVPSTHGADVHSSVCIALAQTSALLSSKYILLCHFGLEELSKNNCPLFSPHY